MSDAGLFSLTPRQRDVLIILGTLQRAGRGVGPTLSEVAAIRGIGKSGVWHQVAGLIERGYVRKIAHRHNAIEVLPAGLALVPEIEFDGCCWGFIPVSRLATRPHGQRSAREPASQ